MHRSSLLGLPAFNTSTRWSVERLDGSVRIPPGCNRGSDSRQHNASADCGGAAMKLNTPKPRILVVESRPASTPTPGAKRVTGRKCSL